MTFKLSTTLILLTNLIFALSSKDLAITIDLCGKERMLTQEMAKEVFLIKSDIKKKENIKKLKQSSELFDKTLKGLIHGDKELKLVAIKNPKIQNSLKEILSIWSEYSKSIKSVIDGKSTKEDYHLITAKSDELLQKLDSVVTQYSNYNKKDSFILANDMNLAGKQRMLLQKMAKLLLLIDNKIDVSKNKKEFLNTKELFSRTLKGLFIGDKELNLRGTKLSTLNKQLKVIEDLWTQEQNRLKEALEGKETQKAIQVIDNLLSESDKLVKLYTASLNRHIQRDEFNSLVKVYISLEEMDNKTKLLIQELAKAETK